MHKYLHFSLLFLLKNKNNLKRLRAKHGLKKVPCVGRPQAEKRKIKTLTLTKCSQPPHKHSEHFKKLQLAFHYRVHLPHHLPGAFFNIGDTSHSKLQLKIDHWSFRFNPANSLYPFCIPTRPLVSLPLLLPHHQSWGDGRVMWGGSPAASPGSPRFCPRTSSDPGSIPFSFLPKAGNRLYLWE